MHDIEMITTLTDAAKFVLLVIGSVFTGTIIVALCCIMWQRSRRK